MSKFAASVNCMDGRVQVPVIEHIKGKYGVDYVDMITLPGANKVLADGKDSSAIASIKRSVKISVDLHGSRLIAIAGHHDCAGNPEGRATQIKQIEDAIKTVKAWDVDARVIGLWIDENRQVVEIK